MISSQSYCCTIESRRGSRGGGGARVPWPPPPFSESLGIDFYSGFKKNIQQAYTFIVASDKKKQGGVQFEILRNPGIDSSERIQVYTFIVAPQKKTKQGGVGGGGVQFEILKNPGIDFYSGFRKKSRYTLL